MDVAVFDERRCELGEGPISFGPANDAVAWVDITGQRVLFKTISSGITFEWNIGEDVGFIIPRSDEGFILGTRTGPIAISPKIEFPVRIENDPEPIKVNDAKVSPTGDLWFGTMSYSETPRVGALYRVDAETRGLKKILEEITVSNGTIWSLDGATMYYIDSPTRTLQLFDYDGFDISNRRVGLTFPEHYGYPDGMTIDAEGGLWIAFWMGNAVRRFDPSSNFKETAHIATPAKRTTSCVFAGENLDQLIITSAHENDSSEPNEAGMTFIANPGVRGVPTSLFKVNK